MNMRMGSYEPLAKTIQYQNQNNSTTRINSLPSVPQLQAPKQTNQANQTNQAIRNTNSHSNNSYGNINSNLKNVVFNDLPMMSNSQ